jgi:hypothetical protein
MVIASVSPGWTRNVGDCSPAAVLKQKSVRPASSKPVRKLNDTCRIPSSLASSGGAVTVEPDSGREQGAATPCAKVAGAVSIAVVTIVMISKGANEKPLHLGPLILPIKNGLLNYVVALGNSGSTNTIAHFSRYHPRVSLLEQSAWADKSAGRTATEPFRLGQQLDLRKAEWLSIAQLPE